MSDAQQRNKPIVDSYTAKPAELYDMVLGMFSSRPKGTLTVQVLPNQEIYGRKDPNTEIADIVQLTVDNGLKGLDRIQTIVNISYPVGTDREVLELASKNAHEYWKMLQSDKGLVEKLP